MWQIRSSNQLLSTFSDKVDCINVLSAERWFDFILHRVWIKMCVLTKNKTMSINYPPNEWFIQQITTHTSCYSLMKYNFYNLCTQSLTTHNKNSCQSGSEIVAMEKLYQSWTSVRHVSSTYITIKVHSFFPRDIFWIIK